MEEHINSFLTLILIGIYWYTSKAQNEKIKNQSDIINDLREHVKFFDLQKIKEYVELRESEKDKLLEITKQAIEKEFDLKSKSFNTQEPVDRTSKIHTTAFMGLLMEPYIFVVKRLFFKSDIETKQILEKEFPKNQAIIRQILDKSRQDICEKFNVESIEQLKDK